MYISTKVFGHDLGISTAFRQWRATHSHCSKIHGYSLAFEFGFAARELDDKNWAVDFGGLKQLKEILVAEFDHRTLIAADDPLKAHFIALHAAGGIDLNIVPAVGCEMFAEMAYGFAATLLESIYGDRIKVTHCKVSEHGANSATYAPHQSFDLYNKDAEFERLESLVGAAHRVGAPDPTTLKQWLAAAGISVSDLASLNLVDIRDAEPSVRKGTDLTTDGTIGQP